MNSITSYNNCDMPYLPISSSDYPANFSSLPTAQSVKSFTDLNSASIYQSPLSLGYGPFVPAPQLYSTFDGLPSASMDYTAFHSGRSSTAIVDLTTTENMLTVEPPATSSTHSDQCEQVHNPGQCLQWACTLCKKKKSSKYQRRLAATIRERNRLLRVNEAFNSLKNRTCRNPMAKMSKVEVLQNALEYIDSLEEYLGGKDFVANLNSKLVGFDMKSIKSEHNINNINSFQNPNYSQPGYNVQVCQQQGYAPVQNMNSIAQMTSLVENIPPIHGVRSSPPLSNYSIGTVGQSMGHYSPTDGIPRNRSEASPTLSV